MNQQSWIFPKKKNYNVNEEREYLKISCFICCCKKRYISNGPNENDWLFFFSSWLRKFFVNLWKDSEWGKKTIFACRLISTLIQTLPAAFVANRALSIRKLNRFFFHIKVLHIRTHEKYEGKKNNKKAVC